MRKILIALISAFILISLPLTTVVKADNFITKCDNPELKSSLFKIDEEEYNDLKIYINSISDPVDRKDANSILNLVISEEGDINLEELGDAIDEFDYVELIKSNSFTPVRNVFDRIINIIQDRLGWVFDCFNYARGIIQDARILINDKDIPKSIIEQIRIIVEDASFIIDLSIMLIGCEWWDFITKWELRIAIIQNIMNVVSEIQSIISKINIVISHLMIFINDVTAFVEWFNSEPWKSPIHVYGQVLEGVKGVSNAKITCRGEEAFSDEEGKFDFYVTPSDSDDDSIPPNSWYGLHNCQIKVEYEDNVKETSNSLSYVFSDGGIYWLFLFEKDESVSKEIKQEEKFPDFLFRNMFYNFYIKFVNKISFNMIRC